ncbi:hypothetical protein [Bacillus cereus]
MGILINKLLDNGLQANNIYGRVDAVMGSKLGIDFSLNYYASQKAFQDGKPYLQQDLYHFKPSVLDSADNFIKQAYRHLKILPEFIESEDILESGQRP